MESLLTLLSSLSPTKWAAIAVLAVLAWRNKDMLTPLLSRLKRTATTVATDAKPTDDDAFHAVKVLLAHFEETKCDAGVNAAREAGRCLFHAPGEHKPEPTV